MGPPKGLICVLPVTDVVKLYVLPTIVALALATNARDKAAARYEARILMSFPFNRAEITGLPTLPRLQTRNPCNIYA